MYLKFASYKSFVSTVTFFLLFPGFFFYHFLIGQGYVPALLGGYFTPIAILLFPILFLSNTQNLIFSGISVVNLFIVLILYIFMVAIINFALGIPEGLELDMMIWSLQGLFYLIISTLIASHLSYSSVIKYGALITFLILLIIIANIGDFGILDIISDPTNEEKVSTYQGLARSCLIILLIQSAVYFRESYKFFIIFPIGTVILFFIGARTEFILFIATFISLYIIYAFISARALLAIAFLSMTAILSVYLINSNYITSDIFYGSRMLEILNILDSSSAQARIGFFNYALSRVAESPLLGDYGSYVYFGGTGSYPHNIFSAWLNLGLTGFLLYILLIGLLWINIIKFFNQFKDNTEYKILLALLILVSGALISSKEYNYVFIGFLIGTYYNFYTSNLKATAKLAK